MIKNLTARNITVNQDSKIAEMAAAHVIPHMLAPQASTQTETLPAKNAQCSTVEGGERCSNIGEPTQGSHRKRKWTEQHFLLIKWRNYLSKLS